MGEISGSFPDYTIFTCKFKTDDALYSWDVFSLQVGNILKLYGSKTHYDYDYCYNLNFFSVIFHQQLNITFRKSTAPPPPPLKKSTLHYPATPPVPCRKGGWGDTVQRQGFNYMRKEKPLFFNDFNCFHFHSQKREEKDHWLKFG